MAEESHKAIKWMKRAAAPLRGARWRAGLAAGAVAIFGIIAWLVFAASAQKERADEAYIGDGIAVLSAQMQGRVRAVRVRNGDAVAAGALLVEIDPSDYAAGAERARTNLERAQAQLAADEDDHKRASAEYARYQPLAQSGLISPTGMEALRADAEQSAAAVQASRDNVEAAKSDLAAAQSGLAQSLVRAPIDGVIVGRVVEPGQVVQPGAPLLSVVPLDGVYVEAAFKPARLRALRPGQAARVVIEGQKRIELRGVVESVAPVRIKLTLTKEAAGLVRPGMPVMAVVDTRAVRD